MPDPATDEQILGFSPQPGDRSAAYNGTYQSFPPPPDHASSLYAFGPNGWDTVPSFIPGKSFYYQRSSNPETNIELVTLTVRLAGRNLEIGWPTQSTAAVLQSAHSVHGPWSIVGRLNPVLIPHINEQQFFRLAT